MEEELNEQLLENGYIQNFEDFQIDCSLNISSESNNSFCLLDEENIIYFSGQTFRIYNVEIKTSKLFTSRDGGGICAISVNSQNQVFAVAESGFKPNIYFYSYEENDIVHVLKNGTERSFSSLAFSEDGERLASVGAYPDFALVLWDWKNETQLLRVKAFSQEIYKVKFSKYSNSSICTSGLAHIKFWKVAKTFTGLKLKGEVGKFGSAELSDIYDMVVLSDGNFVSGSENGNLILWEGSLIKSQLFSSNNQKIHNGSITIVRLLGDAVIMTASKNEGVLRFWAVQQFLKIENGESQSSEIQMIGEIIVGDANIGIVSVDDDLKSQGLLLVVKANGLMIKIRFNGYRKNDWNNEGRVYDIISGSIQVCKNDQSDDINEKKYIKGQVIEIVSLGKLYAADQIKDKVYFGGDSGCLRAVSTVDRTDQSFINLGNIQITALKVFNEKYLLVGQMSGILQIYQISNFQLLDTKKIFSKQINEIIQGDKNLIFVKSNSQFFMLEIDESFKLNPIFVHSSTSQISKLEIFQNQICFGNDIGEIRSFTLYQQANKYNLNNDYSLQSIHNPKIARLQMLESQKPKIDEEDIAFLVNEQKDRQEIEWEPKKIHAMTIQEDVEGDMLALVSSEGDYIGLLYELQFENCNQDRFFETEAFDGKIIRPKRSYPTRHKIITQIQREGNYLMLAYIDGLISIRSLIKKEEDIWRVRTHFQDNGRVLFFRMQENSHLVTVGSDDTVVFLKKRIEDNKSQYLLRVDHEWKNQNYQLNENQKMLETIQNGYSLQQEKIQMQKDTEREGAELIKLRVRKGIEEIRNQYQLLIVKNQQQNSELQISEKDLKFDETQEQKMEEEYQEKLLETSKEVKYEIYCSQERYNKLRMYMNDDQSENILEIQKIGQRGSIKSFKIKKIDELDYQKMNEEIKQIEERYLDKWVTTEVKESKEKETRVLLEMLKQIRKKMQDERGIDQYAMMKNKIKQECSEKENLEQLQKYKYEIIDRIAQLNLQNIDKQDKKTIESNDYGQLKLQIDSRGASNKNEILQIDKYQMLVKMQENLVNVERRNFNHELSQLKVERQEIINKIKEGMKEIEKMNQKIKHDHDDQGVFKQKYEILNSIFAEEINSEANQQNTNEKIVSEQEINEYMRSDDAQELKRKFGLDPNGDYEYQKSNQTLEKKLSQTNDSLTNNSISLNSFEGLALVQVEYRPKRKININEQSRRIQRMQESRLICLRNKLIKSIFDEIEEFNKKINAISQKKSTLFLNTHIQYSRILELQKEVIEFAMYENEEKEILIELEEKSALLEAQLKLKNKTQNELNDMRQKMNQQSIDYKQKCDNYKDRVFANEFEKQEFIYKYFSQAHLRSRNQNNEENVNNEDNAQNDPQTLDSERRDAVLFFEQNDEWVEIFKARFEAEEIMKGFEKQEQNLNNELRKNEEKVQQVKKYVENFREQLNYIQYLKFVRISNLRVSCFVPINQLHLQDDEEISEGVLLPTETLVNLKNHAISLAKGCEEVEQDTKQLKFSKDALVLNINLLRQSLKQAKEELDENFKLKFGEVVDLRILENLKETPRLQELKREFHETEIACKRRIEDAKKSLNFTKETLLKEKRQNTEIIQKITALGNNQIRLNKTLDNTNKQIFKDEKDIDLENSNRNQRDLRKVIELLNSELMELKKEIVNLKKK